MDRPARTDPAPVSGMRRPRIRRRLALISAVATGTVMLAFCIPLSFAVRSVAYDRAIDAAELQARSLAAELATAGNQATVADLARRANSAAPTMASVYLAGRHIVGRLSHAGVPPAAVRAGRAATTTAAGGGRLVWEPVHGHGDARAVVVEVSPGLLTQGVARTWALLFGGGALLVVIAVALADRLGARIVRPLLALVTVTNRLRDGGLEARAVPAGPYEVAEVGQAVNELADRINALLASARLAAADLGHRLRTPLTVLRLDVEAMDDVTAKQRLRRDLDGLEAAVNRLITDTRQAPPEVSAHADLAGAVRDRMAFWSVLARSQHRPFDVQAPSRRVEVSLGRDELDAAIDALLSNVFTHTPEGTAFSVQLRRITRGGSSWSLVVEDQGRTGASRSAKPAPSRRGTGLGLDIVRRTAARAGGTATAGPTLRGFRAEIQIPHTTVTG